MMGSGRTEGLQVGGGGGGGRRGVKENGSRVEREDGGRRKS